MKFLTVLTLTALVLLSGEAMAQDQQKSSGKQQRKQLRIAVQEICPVSGQKLGAHGTPIKVTVGPKKEEIFLCCKACLKGEIDARNWQTIHANMAKAQGKCPVMKKDLPASPKWTVVDGQLVFVCCPPCTDKIESDPRAYLKKVDDYYRASLQE